MATDDPSPRSPAHRDDQITFLVPPQGRSVRLESLSDIIDLAFELDVDSDALLICVDDAGELVVAATTATMLLDETIPLIGRLGGIAGTAVVTATEVTDVAREDDLRAWHHLDATCSRAGMRLIDWVHLDERCIRSLAETSEGARAELRWRHRPVDPV